MIHNNSESSHVSLNMEPGFEKARRFIQERIYEFLMQRQPRREIPPRNVLDIVRRLEDGLFKRATSKEEYMSLDTLENRLHELIKPSNQSTQRYQQQSNPNPSSMGTMIPTPGVQQTMSSADVMVTSSSSVNTASFSSQMMPTPGFNNSNVFVISSVDSTMVSQPQQKQQEVGGQNSRILRSLGTGMGSGNYPRQVSHQPGTSLPSIQPQQNMIHNNSENPRRFIQDRIYEFLMQRQPSREIPPKNVLVIVRRLEEALFKRAASKEEYMSLDTLEHRLHMLINAPTQNTQRYQQQSNPNSNPSSMGTMIPTHGVPQTVSSADVMVTSSSCVNTATFSSQMMPPPGFNNNNIVPPWEMEKLTSTLESLGLSPFDIR